MWKPDSLTTCFLIPYQLYSPSIIRLKDAMHLAYFVVRPIQVRPQQKGAHLRWSESSCKTP